MRAKDDKDVERFGMKLIHDMYKSGVNTSTGNKMFKREKNLTYTNSIPIGWLNYNRRFEIPEKDNLFEINCGEPVRILILGMPRSGKSWVGRGLMNRAYLAGFSPVILTDIAPEWHSSKRPLQTDFKKFLLENEKPVTYEPIPVTKTKETLTKNERVQHFGFPMKVYYPYFLSKFTGFTMPEQQVIQYDMNSISADDLTRFINYDVLSPVAKMEVDDLLARMMEDKTSFKNVDELIAFLEAKEDINRITKMMLIRGFKNLKALGIFGDKYPSPDIIGDINRDEIPDINLFGWQSMDFKKFVALYITIMVRQILTAKTMGRIDPKRNILTIFEELHEFAPKGTNCPESQQITRQAIRDLLSLGRKENVSFVGITQSPNSVDPTVLEYCNYILIPQGFERRKLMDFVNQYAPSMHLGNSYEFSKEMFGTMAELKRHRDGNRDWLVLSKTGSLTKFTPCGVLSRHKGENEAY